MTDTPQFDVKWRGYDRSQVDGFISRAQQLPAGTQIDADFTVVLRGYHRDQVDRFLAEQGWRVR